MLTIFYFDQDLFEDDFFNSAPVVCNQLLDIWKDYGCLAICSKNRSALIAAISSIPVKYQQRWKLAFTDGSFKQISIEVLQNMLSALKGMPEFQAQYYDKNVVTGVLPKELQDSFEAKSINVGNDVLEIISLCSLSESENFGKSKNNCLMDIKAGDVFDDIWSSRFYRMAEFSKKITIIDRYLALNLQQDFERGKVTALELLINKLSKLNKNFSIDVFSACDFPSEQVNATIINTYIKNTLIKKPYFNIHNIQINFSLCKDSFFKDEAHDRMLCFDEHVAQIGKGMDIFREIAIKNNTFTIKSRILTSFDDIYKVLARNREWTYHP